MGFLDKVTKGFSEAAESVTKAVNDAQTSLGNSSPAPAAAATGSVPADEEFIDGTKPETWLDPARLTTAASIHGLLSATFEAPPQAFTRDEGAVARYVSTDGTVTIDVTSVSEAFLERHETWDATLAALKTNLHNCSDRQAGDFDWAYGGSSGPGHARFVAGLADLIGAVDVYAPGGPDYVDVAHNVLFDACRLGEM